MKEPPLALDSTDSDPWTYFGSFSRAEVDGAASLLRENSVVFEIIEEETQETNPASGWSGPFSIWVREEHTGLASSLLVPFFAKQS